MHSSSSPSTCTAQNNTLQTLDTDREMTIMEATSHVSHPDHEHKNEADGREIAQQQQQQDTISHFSHPEHELVKRHYMGPSYLCDMCWEDLSGLAYGCVTGCDFAIHEACAGHPRTLSSPAHDAHQLVLVQTRRDVTHVCDVCVGRCAPGSFLYRCPPCGFDMHQRCAHLPQVVRCIKHPEHDLTLVVGDGSCTACHRGAGRAWYYRCAACSVDLHVSCAAGRGGGAAGAHNGSNQQGGVSEHEWELLNARMEGHMNTVTAYNLGLGNWRLTNSAYGVRY